jgi:hypothetical protein
VAKKKSLVCFGDFIEDNEKCDTCSENVDCFVEVYNKLNCFTLALNLGQCKQQLNCNNDPEKCGRVRDFLKFRENKKKCLGTLNQKSDECLLCQYLDECEIAEIFISNIGIDSEIIKNSIENELNEMRSVVDNCFGQFEFDDECYKDCDFALRCRKETGVVPGESCKYWRKEALKDLEIHFPCAMEDACSSYNTCLGILKNFHNKIISRQKKLKPFTTFQNLEEIRGSFKCSEDD